MDRYDAILGSIPGLAQKLEEAGVDEWLEGQPQVTLGGETFFLLGDRRASRGEAMLWFADRQGLVAPEQVRAAAAGQALPSDTEGVEIDTPEGDK